MAKGYLFYENLRTLVSEDPEHREVLRQLDLNYYLPCVTKGHTIAFIGLGRTARGELLTSEDVELLMTIAGYVAIAIENSRLYESIHEKAEELRRLKDYNESIVESISVGVAVLGLDDRIEGWNTRMESLMGVGRAEAIGTCLADHFPPNSDRCDPFPSEGQFVRGFGCVQALQVSASRQFGNAGGGCHLDPLVWAERRCIGPVDDP